MHIQLAETDADIERCLCVMLQLRPHLAAEDFVARVRRMMHEAYQLAYLEDNGAIQAVAGFRIAEMLHRGRHLYVDDLVTDATQRSRGYGTALFEWLADHARASGCQQLDLDSGVQRADAHRFYFRHRMQITSYHFVLKLKP